MNELKLYFPFASDAVLEQMSAPQPDANSGLPKLNEEIEKVYDTLYPFNEQSGSRSNDVTRLLSSSVSALEKERIMAGMQKLPSSRRHNLSDEELISMLPSRYNSTLTDSDKVRDYFENEILPSLEDGKQGGEEEQGGDHGSDQGSSGLSE